MTAVLFECVKCNLSNHIILSIRAETNTCTIRPFDRFDSIRMLLQLFEYSFEVF